MALLSTAFCTLFLLLYPIPLYAETHPNFTGAWKLDETASPNAPYGVHGTVFQIQHDDPFFKYSASGKRGYMPFIEAYEFTTDAKQPSDPTKVSIVAHWEGQALVMRYFKNQKELAKFVFRLTAGGKMTRDGDLGNNRKIRETYTRQ